MWIVLIIIAVIVFYFLSKRSKKDNTKIAYIKGDRNIEKNNVFCSFDIPEQVISADFQQINFSIENHSGNPIEIVWNKSAIVIDGKTDKIIHNGIKFNQREEALANTVVPNEAKHTDFVVPVAKIQWLESDKNSRWITNAILGSLSEKEGLLNILLGILVNNNIEYFDFKFTYSVTSLKSLKAKK